MAANVRAMTHTARLNVLRWRREGFIALLEITGPPQMAFIHRCFVFVGCWQSDLHGASLDLYMASTLSNVDRRFQIQRPNG